MIARVICALGVFLVTCLASFGFACLTHWAPHNSAIEAVSGVFTIACVILAIGGPIGVFCHDD